MNKMLRSKACATFFRKAINIMELEMKRASQVGSIFEDPWGSFHVCIVSISHPATRSSNNVRQLERLQ